ncbi:MAG: helix-turn-helix domain-containing protein [Flavobacteriales bacterium]|nr:helix-turn-helix domain-containing protein [Flavobacteriales bacterium]
MSEREYLLAIGRNVRAHRKRMNLSLDELAEMLDMDHKTVQRIETAVKVPHITTLKRVADALRTDVRHLLP